MASIQSLFGRLIGFLEEPSPARSLLRRFVWRREMSFLVHGHRMAARTPDRVAALLLWKWGWLERGEELLIESQVKPGMTAVDIGANIGSHTLLLARRVGPTGRVFAFEPEPDNFDLLEKNVAANGYGNVQCLRKAVSDRSGSVALHYSDEHRGDHRIFDSRDGRPSFAVACARLDDALPEGCRVDFIKMDIQGAEMLALQGMRGVLERNRAVMVLCEFSPGLLRLAGCEPKRFLISWEELGFEIFLLNPDGALRAEPDAGKLISSIGGRRYVNLFLRRRQARQGPNG